MTREKMKQIRSLFCRSQLFVDRWTTKQHRPFSHIKHIRTVRSKVGPTGRNRGLQLNPLLPPAHPWLCLLQQNTKLVRRLSMHDGFGTYPISLSHFTVYPECSGWWYQLDHKEFIIKQDPVNLTTANENCEVMDSKLASLSAMNVEFLTAILDSNDSSIINK